MFADALINLVINGLYVRYRMPTAPIYKPTGGLSPTDTATMVSALLSFAGRKELARRVRPSSRRTGQPPKPRRVRRTRKPRP